MESVPARALNPLRRASMHAFLAILAIVAFVAIAVVLLQRFDRTTGRGPRRISKNVEYRIRCERCGEKIVPLTGCSRCEVKN